MPPDSTETPPAFEHSVLPGGMRIGVNSNRKLKTILVKVYREAPLDAETVTARALLPSVLRRGTASFPDMQTIHRHLENLYGAAVWCHTTKIGERFVTRFQLEVVNDRFLPEPAGLLDEGLAFLRGLMYDPHTKDDRFDDDYVEQEKRTHRASIEALLDDKSSYATFRCIEEMCRDEPFRLYSEGRVEDLDAITSRTLYDQHQEWKLSAPMAVYIAGDVEVDAVRDRVARALAPERDVPAPLDLPVARRAAPDSPREVKEQLDVQQGKLVMGFRCGVTYADDDYEALVVMNGILGGFSHSKLFQNVREKESLAYSASSWLEKSKGLAFISCGIAFEHYERAVAISLAQLDAIRRGEVSDEEISATVETITNQNLMLEDEFSSLAAVDYVWGLHGRPLDLARFRERVRAVTKDDIVRVAQTFQHDTTYFLHR